MIYGPYKVVDRTTKDNTVGYIEVRGPNNENICQIFPFAQSGGVGYQAAIAIAKHIAITCQYEPYSPAEKHQGEKS